MADIREFPELNELENRLAGLFKDAVEVGIEQVPELSDELRSLKLNEIIVFASWANDNATIGETQLSLGLILEVPEEIIGSRDPTDIDEFIDARNLLTGENGIINQMAVEWDLFQEWFDGFDVDGAFVGNRSDFITFKINITDSIQAYSLTDDLNIEIVEGEPEFPGGPPQTALDETPAGVREPAEIPPPEEEEGVGPNDILEFPQHDELRLELETTFREGLIEIEDFSPEDFELDRIIINGPWGDGTAEFSRDPLIVNYLVSDSITGLQFRVFAGRISNFVEDNFEPTEEMEEWFDGYEFDALRIQDVDLPAIIRATQGNRVYDILNNEILRAEDGDVIADEFLPEEEEEPPEVIEEEELPPEEIPEEVEEEPEEPTPPLFPEVPDPLQPFAVSPDKLEIPTGKATKTVEPREIYDWEMELASPQGELDGGIGEAMRREIDEEGDVTFGIGIAPGTFPRTGIYVKFHLLNEGPSYVLQMYNDLVIYSGFISTMFEGEFKTGRYDAFRAFMNRIRLLPERGGPQLIERLSPQQASARGLETLPNHPTIEGEKAPWLERRIYYDIIEENVDDDAWNNITELVAELSAD